MGSIDPTYALAQQDARALAPDWNRLHACPEYRTDIVLALLALARPEAGRLHIRQTFAYGWADDPNPPSEEY